MEKPQKFTYPFCYTPHPMVAEASLRLIEKIDGNAALKAVFEEGKMLGTLMVEYPDGHTGFLYAFSGLAGGKSRIDGFVPPILDLQNPDCRFKREEAEISDLNRRIENSTDPQECRWLKERRKEMSVALQDWLFKNYVVLNARGERKSISDIFAGRSLVPPAGTGECAGPKLLQYAYENGLKPLAMGEFWYGRSPKNELRMNGCFYPSCTGKCGPLLAYMLLGLDVEPNPLDIDSFCGKSEEILYEDDDIIVAVKPSGMLAVPGRTMKVSLQERLCERYADGVVIRPCHRLDMDTSGLIVFARGLENLAVLQQQFEKRETVKTYVARLVCAPGLDTLPQSGRIVLPLCSDYYDRPRQIVDFENGKQAVTEWELIRLLQDGRAEVRFYPLTGRTHQLRVHSAHPLGLGRPIEGDRLYGGGDGRLCLHAASLEFTHPRTGERMKFESAPDFI